ncbi:MAG: hypothetical protein J07HQW2_03616 [Haloquadratum walsbyi J07HQW2]|uniref:Uncharacterized protein n=1 Tax=Haloquadratum walsbyi J07HQW2 TaxID=1238425 RepID=U1NIS5_9EURY|nr:MAG: hypothetical protein J07HQW2_03616 [Haloquadratum walsbyi J07HQW2]
MSTQSKSYCAMVQNCHSENSIIEHKENTRVFRRWKMSINSDTRIHVPKPNHNFMLVRESRSHSGSSAEAYGAASPVVADEGISGLDGLINRYWRGSHSRLLGMSPLN